MPPVEYMTICQSIRYRSDDETNIRQSCCSIQNVARIDVSLAVADEIGHIGRNYAILSDLVESSSLSYLHCTLAVQCNVIGPVCGGWVCLCMWLCYHDNSKLRASILTKLGL